MVILFAFLPVTVWAQGAPNILLILADDMGYGDVSINGCQDIPTPSIDALAHSGVNATAGYVTHPYCSPSRAAIMSGRHQARHGHDCNPQGSFEDHSQGIDPGLKLLPARLKEQGYATALIGKWHLGHADQYHPRHRGFDHFYGFLSGGYSYYGQLPKNGDPIYEDDRVVSPEEITYLTTDLGRAANRFINKNQDEPWFCFLSYNAPHAPDQAPQEAIDAFAHIQDPKRRVYAAMVHMLDQSVGEVVANLEAAGQRDNTLIVFLSDNGGRTRSADNGIYRGHKGRTYEGGIRVPFMLSWPGTIAAGETLAQPVSSLDLYATAIHLAGGTDAGADGVNLLPVLKSPQTPLAERSLYYRISGGWGYAVQGPRYKLVKPGWKDTFELYDLAQDPSEANDLASSDPQTVRRLSAAYEAWDQANTDPKWTDPHKQNVAREMQEAAQR